VVLGGMLMRGCGSVTTARKGGKRRQREGFAERGEAYKPQPLLSTDAKECADYIADLTLELRNLARRNQLKFLAQLLEMAFQEAFLLAHRAEPTEADLKRPQARDTS